MSRTSNEFENRCNLRIVRTIASGGMGTVSEAIQYGTGGFEKRVAIKEILPDTCEEVPFVEMFIAEAKLVANLVHENIVQIYQLNQTDSQYYIVMEYVNGMALADFIGLHQGDGPSGIDRSMPSELAVFIASRIARGLAYAHSRTNCNGEPLNIVHRDVCPKNILITTEGLPKLGDFGVASAEHLQQDATQNHAIGKFSYMAPEQAAAATVDHRSDIFSLGLVLLEMLSLQRSRQKWRDKLMIAAVNGWVDWETLPKKTPRRLKSILQQMLALDPEKRFQSTDELAHDLEFYIYGKGYGPTVVTLEKYLRQIAPALYEVHNDSRMPDEKRIVTETTTVFSPEDKTRFLD